MAFLKSDTTDSCEIIYAIKNNFTWSLESVDTFFYQPWNTTIGMALSSSGVPHLLYAGAINSGSGTALRYAVQAGDFWQKQTLWSDNSHTAWCHSHSITLSSRGEPGIAFLVSTGGGNEIDSVLWMGRDSTGWHTVAQRVVGIENSSQIPKPLPRFIFSPSISRQFCFTFSENVTGALRIFTATGSLVFTKAIPSGLKTLNWSAFDTDGKPLSSGIYFATFETGSYTLSRKLVVR